jgi:class 3 adenylate cyclase
MTETNTPPGNGSGAVPVVERQAPAAAGERKPAALQKQRPAKAQKPARQQAVTGSGPRLLSSMSVRSKIAGTLVIILTLAVVTLGVMTFTQQNSILRSEMNRRAATLTAQLASVGKEALLTKQELPVVSTIEDILQRDDVVYAMVVDDAGRVFAHSDFSKKGAVLTGKDDQAALGADGLVFQETLVNGDSVLDAAMPIMLKSKNLKIGIARVGLSQKALNKAMGDQLRIYLWTALGFIVAGLAGSLALARLMTKSLESLAEGIQVVARGDLRRLVPVSSDDEIGKVTGVFNQMILSLREKLLMEKYLSQSTVLNIKEHRDVTQLKLGGERKYVTALFSDARGFTALSEKMTPEEVVSLMNIYLNLQTAVVHQWGGIVDKFVGDEVMAIFEGSGAEINAVRAAIEMQRYCKALNEARAAAGETTVSIGIGLNSGDVVMGNMGSEDHMDYTVIGDHINVAARLCGIAKPGQVLVSKAVADAVGEQGTWNELPAVTLKGKNAPVWIAEAVAVKGGARCFMRKSTDAAVTYWLEGFADEMHKAALKNISAAGCLLEVDQPIGIGSKLNITLHIVEVGLITVRAAVFHAHKQGRMYFVGLCFEDLSKDIRHRIEKWIHQVNASIVEGLFL